MNTPPTECIFRMNEKRLLLKSKSVCLMNRISESRMRLIKILIREKKAHQVRNQMMRVVVVVRKNLRRERV